MNRLLYFVFIFLLLNISNLFAFSVSQIDFKDLNYLSRDTALEIIDFPTSLRKSQEISNEKINKAIKELFKQEYFKNITVEYFDDSETLVFNFEEKPLVSKVEIKGFLENQEEQRKNFLKIEKGSIFDEQKLEKTKDDILMGMSAMNGTIDNAVEVEKIETENGSIEVNFIAREGENIIIDELRFNGAENISKDILEDSIGNRERDGFGWLIGRNDGKLKLFELEQDVYKLRDKYMEYGFLDVQISKPTTKIDFNRYRAELSYQIEEGSQYSVNSVKIEQIDGEIIPEKELFEVLRLKEKDVFNVLNLRKDLEKLKRTFADRGYAFVTVSPDVQQNRKEKFANITFKIEAKEKVFIRDVIISGNSRTMDKIVRREIYLAPQDLYSLTDLEDSKRALGRLGYFENVEIKEERVDENHIDLIVKVSETMTGSIQIGGGYSSYQGLIFDSSISDRNIFGSGLDVGVGLQTSDISTNYNISFYNPRVFDSLFSASINLYQNEFEYTTYTIYQQGFSLGFGQRFGRNITTNFGYSFSETDYSDIDDSVSAVIESYDKQSVYASIKYDNTDDYFTPRKGFAISHRIEYAGFGGEAKFLENSTNLGIYKGLDEYIGYDLILRFKSQLRVMNNKGFIPINESFHMGGPSSVRGYQSYAFPDRDYDEYATVKGTRNLVNSFEASLPISQKAKLRLTFFVDYGYLGTKTFTDIAKRGGYGTAIEWISPMAPLQFIFARPFDNEVGDDLSSFEFTLGRRF